MTELSRRTLLTGIATTSTIAVAGCTGGDPETPEEVTEAYYTAYINVEYEEALSYTTDPQRDQISESDMAEYATEDPEIEEVILEEKDEDEGRAEVSIVVSGETALGPASTTDTVTLEKEDDEWLISDVQ